MAEGPSIVILKERAGVFVGDVVLRVEGNTPIAKERLIGQRILALRSFGKHFLIELPTFALRVHLLSERLAVPRDVLASRRRRCRRAVVRR